MNEKKMTRRGLDLKRYNCCVVIIYVRDYKMRSEKKKEMWLLIEILGE